MKNQKVLKQLKNTMTKMVSIPEEEWRHFGQHLSQRTFEKKGYLVHAGEVTRNFYFITSGLVRFFYSTRDGKEFNKHFAMENGFAGSLHSLVRRAPCGFFIQALEKTATIVLPHDVMHAFNDSLHAIFITSPNRDLYPEPPGLPHNTG